MAIFQMLRIARGIRDWWGRTMELKEAQQSSTLEIVLVAQRVLHEVADGQNGSQQHHGFTRNNKMQRSKYQSVLMCSWRLIATNKQTLPRSVAMASGVFDGC